MNEKGLVVQLKERESEVLSAGWLTPGVVVLRMVQEDWSHGGCDGIRWDYKRGYGGGNKA